MSQWWDAGTFRARQMEGLREVVNYAFLNVPFYRERYRAIGFDGELGDWGDFRCLPLLSKKAIKDGGLALLSGQYGREDLVEARTGGSTGTALTVYFDKRCQALRNAAAIRSNLWAGWDIGMSVAAIWGNPPVANTIREKLRDILLGRTIYLDTMDINDQSVQRFVEKWRRVMPQVLFGHSHSIYILARYVRQLGVRNIRPKAIISTSMMLLVPEREFIEQTFQCRVTDRYGCEEVGLIACECEQHNGMHLNADHVVVEFLREDGSPAACGEEGNIVVTDLINRGMPLIRYRIEDVGVPSDRTCECGRGLPLMERVTGRQADFLKRPDGSLVAGVSLVERTLTAIPGVEQMQLIQNELQRILVKVVKGREFYQGTENALRQELQSVLGGSVAIQIQYVTNLDQTRAGKYRFAICNV